MKVLAIDPGYDRFGLAILEKLGNKEVVVYSTCIETDKKSSQAERLTQIGLELENILKKHKPQKLVIEKLFFSVNKKTALGVAEVRGVALFLAQKNGLQIYEFHPADVKIAITGNGKADKKAIYFMAKRLVTLPDRKMQDDEIDAICLGITLFAHFPR